MRRGGRDQAPPVPSDFAPTPGSASCTCLVVRGGGGGGGVGESHHCQNLEKIGHWSLCPFQNQFMCEMFKCSVADIWGDCRDYVRTRMLNKCHRTGHRMQRCVIPNGMGRGCPPPNVCRGGPGATVLLRRSTAACLLSSRTSFRTATRKSAYRECSAWGAWAHGPRGGGYRATGPRSSPTIPHGSGCQCEVAREGAGGGCKSMDTTHHGLHSFVERRRGLHKALQYSTIQPSPHAHNRPHPQAPTRRVGAGRPSGVGCDDLRNGGGEVGAPAGNPIAPLPPPHRPSGGGASEGNRTPGKRFPPPCGW